MKRVFSVVIAILVVFSMVSGCASGTQEDKTASDGPDQTEADEATQTEAVAVDTEEQEPAFKIGYMDYPIVSPMLSAVKANVQYVCESLGGTAEFVVINELSTEAIIDCVEQLIQLDVDAIVICPFTEAPMAKIARLCDEAGVYFMWRHRQIFDEEISQLCFSSEYFLGWAVEDDYDAAYRVVKYMAEEGITEIAMITEDLSDTVAAERESGALAAAEEYGVNIVGAVRGLTQATQVTEAVGSFIASYPELQLVFCTGATTSGLVDGILSAFEQAGRDDIKIGSLDFLDGSEQATKDGIIIVQAGGQHVPNAVYCTVVAINALVNGERLGGEPIKLSIALSIANDYSDLENYNDYAIGNLPLYTADELKELFLTDLTVEKMMEYAAGFDITNIAELHTGLEQGSVDGFHNPIFD